MPGIKAVRFQKETTPLLSSILLTILMLVGVGIVTHDALTIRDAEEIEEDTSRLLLNAEQWLNHQQEIEVAVRSYVVAGRPESLAVIEKNRREAVAHEQGMKEILDEYRPEEAQAQIKGLLAFAARHQHKIDEIVALKKAGDDAAATSSLVETDANQFIYGARLVIDNIIQELHAIRTAQNTKVSVNALRGSISFGLMTLLMVAVIWTSFVITTRVQRRNRELSEQLVLKATHDALTRLPNRDLFYDRLSQSISQARRKRQHLAVLYLDLDGFKTINDAYGHQVGDATLKEASRRLRASVREVDTVARLGGDEFAIVLNEIKAPADAGHVAEKIIDGIAAPMPLYGGGTYEIGVSIGIAIYPDSGVEIDRLVKAADNAMYASKTRGKNTYTYSTDHAVASPAADGWVSFKDDFLVGINAIDEQHEALAGMLNKLNLALAMQKPRETMARQLDEIVAYTAFHFQTEERLMEQYRYPEASAHRDEHQRLIGEMKYLKVRFAEGGELLVLQWLKDWLTGHITGSDRALSEYLLACNVK